MRLTSIKKKFRTRKVAALLSLALLTVAVVATPRAYVVRALSKLGLTSAPAASAVSIKVPASNRNYLKSLKFLNAANPNVTRDDNAVKILQAAFEAIGGNRALASIADSVIEGQINIPGPDGATGSVVVKVRGFSQVRTDTQLGSKTFTTVIDKGKGYANSDGKAFDLPAEYGSLTRTNLLPIFGHFARFINNST